MASWDYEFPPDQAKKDATLIWMAYQREDKPMPELTLPDHSRPFVLGQYKAVGGDLPEWNSEHEEILKDWGMPSDRVLFDKVLNTRLPEDMSPADYDQMIYLMETMVKNSPYREGVFQRAYSDKFSDQRHRADWWSAKINDKTGEVATSLYQFAVGIVPWVQRKYHGIQDYFSAENLHRIALRVNEQARDDVTRYMTYDPKKTRAMDITGHFDLENQTALITGGTSGIGKEIAKSFASSGASVILPTRDLKLCQKMASEWQTEFRNPYIHCAQCDLSSMTSIVEFLSELKEAKIVPDFLVNAAATLKPIITHSNYGTANIAMSTNLLGPMVLTDGIIGLMDEAAQAASQASTSTASPNHTTSVFGMFSSSQQSAEKLPPTANKVRKIINVSCAAADKAAIRGEELTASGLGDISGVRAYNVSKLGLVAHAQHTARWLERTGRNHHIVINSVDPGFTRDTQLYKNTFFKRLRALAAGYFAFDGAKTAEVAAAPIVRLLLDPTMSRLNGLYYVGYDVAESPMSKRAPKWNAKFLNAMEDLKEGAVDATLEGDKLKDLKLRELLARKEFAPLHAKMQAYYIRQNEKFERSLELPMPEMPPEFKHYLRPPPPHELPGAKPLGIGPPDAPLIGEDLRHNWKHITDTTPVMVGELLRRVELSPPKPSPEEQAAIDQTQAEWEALKQQIMFERQLKSDVTSQYDDPMPSAHGETLWGWFKAKVNTLTKPTIN